MATGRSIHIGLNHVDPSCYNGWDGALSGCINDARDMKAIADGLGYQSMMLTDSAATSDNVVAEIGQAASSLGNGDILLLTYSGHGGQVDDVNGDEPDALDETWVLWDRQLIDDELYSLWSQFAPGVRIAMLSDSCHSGTVLRMMATLNDLKEELGRTKDIPTEAQRSVIESLTKALDIENGNGASRGASPMATAPAPAAAPKKSKSRAAGKSTNGGSSTTAVMERDEGGGTGATSDYAASTRDGPGPGATATMTEQVRTIPPDVQELVNTSRAAQIATQQYIAGPSEKATIEASVILISGCQDDQLSADGSGNGLFTEKVKAVWNSGSYAGDYRSFATDIAAKMPAKQQPRFETTGASNPTFEGEKPFTIGTGGGGGAVTPTPTTGRPTLRRGSNEPAVSELQQQLVDAGYAVVVDGDFGPGTEGSVKQFQSDQGLDADGIVGPATWAALDSAGGNGSGPTPNPDDGPAPNPDPSTRPTIRQGSSGPDVEYLQGRLIDFGYNLTVDGDFGPMTASAVRSFQNSSGLTADGIVGPATWEALG
jgi:peptidoglycan hydrolase-like protein with peptidoglycan-binding domain